MTTNQADSGTYGYIYDSISYAWRWQFGVEAWCNLEGRYTHIVADFSRITSSYQVSLCSIGVMGTKYDRSSTVVTSHIIKRGDALTFNVEHIQS